MSMVHPETIARYLIIKASNNKAIIEYTPRPRDITKITRLTRLCANKAKKANNFVALNFFRY